MKRVMHLKQKEETKEKTKNSLKGKTATVAKVNIAELIDNAYEWDVEKKKFDTKVKEAKIILLAHAKQNEWKEKMGKNAKCKIGPSTTAVVGVKPFLALLKKLGKVALVPDLLKVKITDAKKYLGEIALEDVTDSQTEPYGSVSLKPLKK